VQAGAIGLVETGLENYSYAGPVTNADKPIRNIQTTGFAFYNTRPCHYE